MRNEPILMIITGFRGAGKTTLCTKLVAAARHSGWNVTGVISPPVYEGQKRVAIEVINLKTNEKKRLAVRRDDTHQETSGLFTKNWLFDSLVVAWADQVLKASLPADLLVVDELGELEFERGAGWQAGLMAIDSGRFKMALVVIRSELLGEALTRWPGAYIVEIDTPEDSTRKAEIMAIQFFQQPPTEEVE